MASRRSRRPQVSYTSKAKTVRQFYRIPSGKLTPQKKRFLTTKFNEIKNFTALKFHALPKDERDKFSASGYRVTDKGVFFPQRKGERIDIRDKHIKHTVSTQVGKREEFEFPLSKSEIKTFFNDPKSVIDSIVSANPRIFNPRKGVRRRWRLVFNLGDGDVVRGADELEEYIKQILEQPLREKNGRIKTSGEERAKQIGNNMVGIRVVFFHANKTRKRKSSKSKKK